MVFGAMSTEQCIEAAASHHGEPTWQWKCRAYHAQHSEVSAAGVSCVTYTTCCYKPVNTMRA